MHRPALRSALAWLLCLPLCLPLWAGTDQGADPSPLDASAWPVASDAELDALRGGFDSGDHLAVSFGLVRSVSINGELVSETRFVLPDLAHVTAEQAQVVSAALGSAQIVQNGLGNQLDRQSDLAQHALATVVQNSLNNQAIRTLTVIDAGVNSLGLLQSLNTQGTLRDALIGALGVR